MRLSKLGRVGVLSQERTARGELLYGDDRRDKGGGSGIDSGRPAREEKKNPERRHLRFINSKSLITWEKKRLLALY